MSAGVLGEVVAAGELFAALVAFERLVMGVERAVVTLEVFLTTEAAGTEIADECLGWIIRE